MKTPEGKLKDRVKVDLYSRKAYFFMPVQMGYGKQTIDFLCCVPFLHNGGTIGRFLGVETKAPGKTPTPRQEACIREIINAGGVAFWCDSFESYLANMAVRGFGE